MRAEAGLFSAIRFSILGFALATALAAQVCTDSSDILPTYSALTDERILGVLPTYMVVDSSAPKTPPLTKHEKFKLFFRETTDPSTFIAAGIAAGLSQFGNNAPRYGVGAGPYGQRLGAAYADIALDNFFSDAVLASVFHQDPRYYRMGEGHSFARRTVYSLSRLFITRQDSGRPAFNASGLLGMGMAIGLSNAYYPAPSVNGATVSSHFVSNIIGASVGNLLPEFWPDLKKKFARNHN